jgi:hypothetical protein
MTAHLLVSSCSKHQRDLAEAVAVTPDHAEAVAEHRYGGVPCMRPTPGLSLLPTRFQKVVVRSCAINSCVWLEAGSSCRCGGNGGLLLVDKRNIGCVWLQECGDHAEV